MNKCDGPDGMLLIDQPDCTASQEYRSIDLAKIALIVTNITWASILSGMS